MDSSGRLHSFDNLRAVMMWLGIILHVALNRTTGPSPLPSGLFLRFMGTQNRVLRYISDSSYWVFLVHMLGTIGFGAMLYSMPVSPLTKMALSILATTAACMLTYQLLVRYTLVGVLLNGRRHAKDKPLRSPAPV